MSQLSSTTLIQRPEKLVAEKKQFDKPYKVGKAQHGPGFEDLVDGALQSHEVEKMVDEKLRTRGKAIIFRELYSRF
jgi:hypothetical protein